MSFKKFFLPGGLILAVVVSCFLPAPGKWVKHIGAVPVLVLTIFLVNGFQTQLKEMSVGRKFFLVLGVSAVISLLLGPLVGFAVVKLFSLVPALAMGLLVMSAVPPTLSSGVVITEVSGGNRLWALFLTIAINVLGIFTIPFVLRFSLSAVENIHVDSWPLLKKLFLLVLLPFLTGYGAKRLEAGRFKLEKYMKYIPSTCIILTVWASMSYSRGDLLKVEIRSFLVAAAAALGIHIILLIVCYAMKYPLKLPPHDSKAMVFVVSQKTLPIAITVLAGLNVSEGPALIACILFHFLQLILDSFIASSIRKERSGEILEKVTGKYRHE